jgi:hypothetical protein
MRKASPSSCLGLLRSTDWTIHSMQYRHCREPQRSSVGCANSLGILASRQPLTTPVQPATRAGSYVQAITGRAVEEWAKAGSAEVFAPKTDCEAQWSHHSNGGSRAASHTTCKRASTLLFRWGIELAAGFSRERVLAHYSRVMGNANALIGRHDPILTYSQRRGLRPFYQAWIGADSREAAVVPV